MEDRRESHDPELGLMRPEAGGGGQRRKGPPGSATRTPGGWPNRCPVCGHKLRIEPSLETGDAPCPRCGHLLWFRARRVRPSTRPVFHIVLRKLLAAVILLTPAAGLAAIGYWVEALVFGALWLLLVAPSLPSLLRWLRSRRE